MAACGAPEITIIVQYKNCGITGPDKVVNFKLRVEKKLFQPKKYFK